MHISNHKHQETYPESLSNLKFFKLLDFTIKDLLFYSLLISKLFQWVGTFLIPMILRWKNKSKKTLFFLSSLCLMKVLSFLSIFFQLPKMCSLLWMSPPNDYLPKTSLMKIENPNGVIRLLWKACWTQIFYLS